MRRQRGCLAEPDDDHAVGLGTMRRNDVEDGHGLAGEFATCSVAEDAGRIGVGDAGRKLGFDRLQQDGDTPGDTMGLGKADVDLAGHGDSNGR